MSNTSSQSQNNRRFQCTRCTLSFSHQKAYYEHLRSHAPVVSTDDTARYIAERRK